MVNFNRIACALAVAGLASSQSLGSAAPSHTGLPPSEGSGRPIGTGGHGPRPTNFPIGTGGGFLGSRPTNLPSFSGSPPPFPSGSGAAVAAIAAQESGFAHGSGRPHHSGFPMGTGIGGAHSHGPRPTDFPSGSGAPPPLPSDASFSGPAPSGIARRQESGAPSFSGPVPSGGPHFTGARPTVRPTGARPSGFAAPSGFGHGHSHSFGGTEGPRPTGPPPSGVPTFAPSGFVTKRRA